MKAPILGGFLCCTLPGVLWPQSQTAPTQPPAEARQDRSAPAPIAGQQTEEDDRFPRLWRQAEDLKTSFEKVSDDNMANVERLLRTRRCQIARIGGLLDRTKEAMQQWLDAAKKYWEVWGQAEETRVEGQEKTLASFEVDQESVRKLLGEESKNREDLERRKANLEQGRRTEEISRDIDELVKDIRDSEARLDQAQKDFDSLTVQISNMKTSIQARVINIRQHSARLDALREEMTAYYEKSRAAAQEVCNTKQPGTPQTPLPKSKSNPN